MAENLKNLNKNLGNSVEVSKAFQDRQMIFKNTKWRIDATIPPPLLLWLAQKNLKELQKNQES